MQFERATDSTWGFGGSAALDGCLLIQLTLLFTLTFANWFLFSGNKGLLATASAWAAGGGASRRLAQSGI